MRENKCFYIEKCSSSETGKIRISGWVIYGIPLVFSIMLFCFGWMLHDYTRLMTIAAETPHLKAELAKSEENAAFQRQQIQLFAGNLNTLKKQIKNLSDFEQKIRVIANLQTNNEGGIFGLGGPHVDDLDMHMDFSGSQAGLMRDMRDRVEVLDRAAMERIEDFETLLSALEEKRTLLASTPAVRPTTGILTSKFGSRVSPITGKGQFHSGLDIANRIGTPIQATADGVVSHVGDLGAIGLAIHLDHGHGIVTRYGHLNKSLVSMGQRVKRGDMIAEMGNTGRSTGPHLHYEVRVDGTAVNPVKYIFD